AGPTLRTFVTNDNDIAFADFLALQRVQHVFFGVVDLCGPRELQPFLAGDLGDSSFRSEVALQNLDMPGRLQRIRKRTHDWLPLRQAWKVLDVFPQRLPRHSDAISI